MLEGLFFFSMMSPLVVVFQNLLSLDDTVYLSVQLNMKSSLSTISLTLLQVDVGNVDGNDNFSKIDLINL